MAEVNWKGDRKKNLFHCGWIVLCRFIVYKMNKLIDDYRRNTKQTGYQRHPSKMGRILCVAPKKLPFFLSLSLHCTRGLPIFFSQMIKPVCLREAKNTRKSYESHENIYVFQYIFIVLFTL